MAKKRELRGRLRYEKENDTFYIEIWDDEYECWGLDMCQQCLRAEGAPADEEPALLHYSMLKELAHMAELGYSIHIARGC